MAVGRKNPYVPLIALLTGHACAKYQKLDYDAWSADTGMSASTLRRRIAAPEGIKLGELGNFSRSLGITPEEILRAALRL